MPEEIMLYTLGTGFPDLEIKIAYGLARVGIEAGANIEVSSEQGYYQLRLSNTFQEKFNKAFLMLAQRILSSDRWFDLGVKSRWKSIYPTVGQNKQFKESLRGADLVDLYSSPPKVNYTFDQEKACGHREVSIFGSNKKDNKQLGGLILLASLHAGKPYKRDKVESDFNLGLCEVCGYLATLGSISFSIVIHLGKAKGRKFVSVLPVPFKVLSTIELLKLLSLQKVLHNSWLSDLIPLHVFTLGLLAKFPSLCDIIKETDVYFHLSLLSKDSHGDTVVEQTKVVNVLSYLNFIDFSSYNASTVEKLLGGWKNNPPKIASLNEIAVFLERGRKNMLTKFARLYLQETSNFLYPATSNYLLREVAMIKDEIIKDDGVRALAKTLGYFVWSKNNKNYSYADGIRNARSTKELREIVEKLLREARLRYDQEEEKVKEKREYVPIPSPSDIEKFNKWSNESFEETKAALFILAFTWNSPQTIKKEVQNA